MSEVVGDSLQKHYYLQTYEIFNYSRMFVDIFYLVDNKKHDICSIPLCDCEGGHKTKLDAQYCKVAMNNWINLVANKM